ncbi:LysR family transcriptional regulator [Vibrio hannami]|uniref:LysR family transcriptional regulator n=1 Tax=Vibrio hannami TaxID=2717094 RepID=UPI003EBC6983
MDKLDMMKTFVTVAQEGSFSKAADKLDMSPQLVSKYVSNLEKKIQARLLNRTTRKVTLTEAGRQYTIRCNQVLNDIDEMENALIDWHQKVAGVLTINAPMSFGHRHLPRVLVDFQAKYPDVEVRLNLTDSKVDIVAEGVDIALRIGSLKSESVIARKITTSRIAILASPEYLEKNGTPSKPEELAGHDFLNYSYADQDQLTALLGVNASEQNIRYSVCANNGDMLVSSAILGAGVTIQPTFIAGDYVREGKLVRILEEHEPDPVGLYLIYANRQFLPSKTRAFIDFLSNYYDDVPYWDQC